MPRRIEIDQLNQPTLPVPITPYPTSPKISGDSDQQDATKLEQQSLHIDQSVVIGSKMFSPEDVERITESDENTPWWLKD